jgi:hypothetical protein
MQRRLLWSLTLVIALVLTLPAVRPVTAQGRATATGVAVIPHEAVANFFPGAVFTRTQHFVNPLLESLDRLLGRTGCQVGLAGFPPVARPKSVAQKIEAFLLGIPDTGLLLVQSQAQPRHHRSRPLSRFLRFSAA